MRESWQRFSRQRIDAAVPYAGMAVLTLLLWLPFSFKTTGLVEEWGVTKALESGSQLFFITPHSPFADHRLRPFEMFFHSLAHALDPDSFLFYNVFQCLFLFGKMAAVYWLIQQLLPGRRLLGLVTGVLFVLYPADTGVFTFRAMHIHAAILAYLLAANLLIRFVRRSGPAERFALAGAGALLTFSLMCYQVALPLALVTPVVLLAFARWQDRRLWIASAAWYTAITIAALYAAWALHQGSTSSYEMDLVDVRRSRLTDIPIAIGLAYQRQVAGWATAWNEMGRYPDLRSMVGLGIALFAGIAGWVAWAERRDGARTSIPGPRLLLMLATSVSLVMIGMSLFLLLPNREMQDFRIYLLAMLGSASALALGLFGISSRLPRAREAAFVCLALPFVGLGYTFALHQHQYYVNYSLLEQQVLEDTLDAAPRLKPNTVVVYADPAGFMDDTYVYYFGWYLEAGVRYVYGDQTLEAVYCPVGGAGTLNTDCQFGRDAVHVVRTAAGFALDETISYARVVIYASDADRRLRIMTPDMARAEYGAMGYDPTARIEAGSRPRRAETLFSCKPALSCIRESTSASSSFDLPTSGRIGTAWRSPEPDPAGGTFRWSLQPVATVDANLTHVADLALEFRVVNWLDDDVMNSLAVSINDIAVPVTYEPALHARNYRGVLPRAALARSPGETRIVFRINHVSAVPGAPGVKLGFALGDLRIRPIN